MNKKFLLSGFFGLGCFVIVAAAAKPSGWLDEYDMVWSTPSKDARGSMPLGNGEVTLNAWVEPGGDLQFYIGRSDSYSEISRLLKVGLIRVSLSPNPFEHARGFSQRIRLRDGLIEIEGGDPTNQVRLKLFVEPDEPVIGLACNAAQPVVVTIRVESWRSGPRTIKDDSSWTMAGAPHPLVEAADHFPEHLAGAVAWYHRNETSVVPETLAHQGLTSAMGVVHDPLLHRTFGGYVFGRGLVARDARTLSTRHPVRSFFVRVASPCAQTDSAADWLQQASRLARGGGSAAAAQRRTARWWHAFWDRSWVHTTGYPEAASLTCGYALQRYMQACGGRGQFPIKFNGGAFTVGRDGKMDDADFRMWGDCHWFQNIRHMYYPMLESGDEDMTEAFFRLYERVAPLCEARARLYEGVEGVYFPETMTVWGTYANRDYGWDRAGHTSSEVLCPWWAKTRNQAPELVGLMLDRWLYTQDKDFLRKEVLPMAVEVLTYFDQRFACDPQGKLVLTPTQAVETYWENVTNDTPTVAGLLSICGRLCELPSKLTMPAQRALFEHMRSACPELPMEDKAVEGHTRHVIAPAEAYISKRHNVENPELYAVWPFRLFGVEQPGLQVARETYAVRGNHLDVGWGPHGNCAAVLGLADEAARILEVKCRNSNPAYRWPATWGPNYDWMPDQNHGGNLLNTTQLMLLQAEGRKILLFPAWPRDWDVDFKLRAPYRTTVEATLHGGKVVRLRVRPRSRAADVIIAIPHGNMVF